MPFALEKFAVSFKKMLIAEFVAKSNIETGIVILPVLIVLCARIKNA
jgi:hypothetical protein